jgi:hypothetical protein
MFVDLYHPRWYIEKANKRLKHRAKLEECVRADAAPCPQRLPARMVLDLGCLVKWLERALTLLGLILTGVVWNDPRRALNDIPSRIQRWLTRAEA